MLFDIPILIILVIVFAVVILGVATYYLVTLFYEDSIQWRRTQRRAELERSNLHTLEARSRVPPRSSTIESPRPNPPTPLVPAPTRTRPTTRGRIPPSVDPVPSVPQMGANQIRVIPLSLGIVALRAQNTIDPQVTTTIRNNRMIEVNRLNSVVGFRPVLKIVHQGTIPPQGSLVVIKYVFFRDGGFLVTYLHPLSYQAQLTSYPPGTLNLTAYKRNNQLQGWWELKVGYVLVTPADRGSMMGEQLANYLRNLQFNPLAEFKWEVTAARADQLLTETGERRRPIDPSQLQSNQDINLGLNDI